MMKKDDWTKASVRVQTLLRSNASPTAVTKARERMEALQRDYWVTAKAEAAAILGGDETFEEAAERSGVELDDLAEAMRMLPQDIAPPMADPEDEDKPDKEKTR